MLGVGGSFSIFMPKLTEHNSKNQDPYSNQACLSKYRNLKEKIQSVKLKIFFKLSVWMLQKTLIL